MSGHRGFTGLTMNLPPERRIEPQKAELRAAMPRRVSSGAGRDTKGYYERL